MYEKISSFFNQALDCSAMRLQNTDTPPRESRRTGLIFDGPGAFNQPSGEGARVLIATPAQKITFDKRRTSKRRDTHKIELA